MNTSRVTVMFKKDMKMSDLIDADYRLLSLLIHMKIHLGFGEKSVEAVCKEAGINAECFIFLANLYTNRIVGDPKKYFQKLPLQDFLFYLKRSHAYFLSYRLPNIRRKMNDMLESTHNELKNILMDFFDKYYKEVKEHMNYEDEVVFPYVQQLITQHDKKGYSIMVFEDRHHDIEQTMSDLKNLLMKYINVSADQNLLVNILMELNMAQAELRFHTYIEDELVIPSVKKIETNN